MLLPNRCMPLHHMTLHEVGGACIFMTLPDLHAEKGIRGR